VSGQDAEIAVGARDFDLVNLLVHEGAIRGHDSQVEVLR
jgi:hypothetical protein